MPGFSDKDKKKNIITYERFKKIYDEYLEWGGFPQVVLANDAEQKAFYLKDIFKSYFEKDVQVLSDFRQIGVFRDLILILLQRVGNKLDIRRLASEVGVLRETVYSYLSFLQATYFIFFSPAI